MSEEEAVRTMMQQWAAASNQPGDAGADAYMSFVTDDAVVLPPNAERAEGREAVRAVILGFTQSDGWSIDFRPDKVELSAGGDLAGVVGSYEFSFKDSEGNRVEDRGKFLDTLRKGADGAWKASAVSFNSDLP